MTTETTYGIDWGDGRVTKVGKSRDYAEQLLREASGPFLASQPEPSVVEVTACPPKHTAYPSRTVANNAITLHRMAFRYCSGYHAWACGDHWHVGHPSHQVGEDCKTHPTHRAMAKRIRRARDAWGRS